jgi:hypothetical protein
MRLVRASAPGIIQLAALALVGVAGAAAAQSAEIPTVWTPHAIIVNLDALPKRYTCDELWYRFRAILLSLGAQADLKVVPYHCDGQSPSVQLQFSLPDPVEGAQARFADLKAVIDTITLAPGHPAPLEVADCELVRQIKDELFTALPVRVLSAELSCAVSPANRGHFRLSVQALRPVAPSEPAAGAASTAAGAAPAPTSNPKPQR